MSSDGRTAATRSAQGGAVDPERRQQLAELSRQANENVQRQQELENAEARKILYADVEKLINPGFLAGSAEVGRTIIALRSMSPGDMILLKYRVHSNASMAEWKSWVLATCTWMVGGQLLLDDPHASLRMYHTYRSLPGTAREILWSIFHGLQTRVSACLPRVEAYCYEDYSRALWKFCGRQSPSRDEFVGIGGVSRLGLNVVQRIWVSYNTGEDERLQEITLWNSAKLIASAANPKGVKKLNASDEQRFEQESRRRRRVQDQMYFDAVGWKDAHSKLVFQPHSADELVEQMRRWQDGEKDLHDIIVDAWKERVRGEESQRKAERAEAAAERKRRDEMAEVAGVAGFVGYSEDQLRAVLGGERMRPRRRVVHEKPGNSVKFDRFLSEPIDMGFMGEGGARPLDIREESPATLDEQVASRRPLFQVPEHLRGRFEQDLADTASQLDGSPMPTEGEEP